MQVSDVVLVDVSIAARSIATQDFGTLLVAAYHNHYADRVRTYAADSFDTQLIAEGFTALEPAYKAVAAAFAQDPRPSQVMLGRLSNAETQVVRITPVAGPGLFRHLLRVANAAGVVSVVQLIEDGTPTVAEICTGLAAALNSAGMAFTAVGSSGTHVEVTANAPNVYFSFYDMTQYFTLRDVTTSSGIATDLSAIKVENSDWYGLSLATPAPIALEQAADWQEANGIGIFSASTHDMGLVTNVSDDFGTSIQAQSYQRTLVSYHSKCLQYFGTAWAASMLTYQPGEVDWSAKTIEGCTPDKLTPSQEGFATQKYVSTYGEIAKIGWTGIAKTGSGYFVDLVQTKDWLRARTGESLVAKRAALPKVPFTDEGVGAMVLETFMEVVKLGQELGSIDTNPETIDYQIPKVLTRTLADRTARKFTGSKLSVRSTGGVHLIEIKVNVAV